MLYPTELRAQVLWAGQFRSVACGGEELAVGQGQVHGNFALSVFLVNVNALMFEGDTS